MVYWDSDWKGSFHTREDVTNTELYLLLHIDLVTFTLTSGKCDQWKGKIQSESWDYADYVLSYYVQLTITLFL